MILALPAAILLSGTTLVSAQPERDPEARFERLDEDGDGSLSRDELSMLARARFDELDANDNDGVDLEEFRELESGLDPKVTFRRIDADEDGRISEEELPGWLRARFDNVDTDGNGFIDEDEMKMMALRAREARNAPSGLMRRLMELDLDGDGRLHRDELPEAMEYLRARFEEFDFDADGYLDGAEIRAMTEAPWWRRK